MFQIKRIYAVLFILLTVLSVYYATIFAEVLSIDDQKMLDNLLNIDSFTFKGVFLPGGGYYYRPLLSASFIADKFLWGLHESFMHLENMLLHAINACLVFYITIRVASRQGEYSTNVPLFAALLFALHPLATEPVNWLSGRTDLIAGALLFASFLALLYSLEKGSLLLLLLASFFFFLSPLAKETSIFWYPAALYLVYASCRDPQKKFPRDLFTTIKTHAVYYLALTAAPVGYFILRHFALKSYDSGIGLAVKGVVTSGNYDLYNKIRITLKVFGFYFKKLIAPLPLNFIINSVSNWYVIVGIIGIIFCLYLCWRRSLLSSLLLMSVCIISPTLLVPLGHMALAPVAERYLYMPTAFFAIALAVWGASLLQRYRVANNLVTVIAMLILLGAGYATLQRNLIWQTNLSFFQECVRQNPDFIPTRNELATALKNAGRVEEAERLYLSNQSPVTGNYHIVTEINRANVMAANNDVKGAIALLKGIDCQDSNPFFKNYLQSRLYLNGLMLQETKDIKLINSINRENVELTKKLLANSGDPYNYYQIGKLCMIAADNKQAVEYFRLAVEKSPPQAFYTEPARKLAERLSTQMENKN